MLEFLENASNSPQWNATNLAFLYNNQKAYQLNTSLPNVNLTSPEEWKYFNMLVRFYTILIEKPDMFDWSTKNIGSFFIKNLLGQFMAEIWFDHYCRDFHNDIQNNLENVHQMFTFHDQLVSLPDITYLHSIMDFRELSLNYSTKFASGHFSRMNFDASFKNCFDEVANTVPTINKNSYYNQHVTFEAYMNILPCAESYNYTQCLKYCTWHKEFLKDWTKEDFFTIMRYALPQRKVSLDPIVPYEKKIAEKLFGPDKITNLEYFVSPMAMSIYCHNKDKGFTGEDIGLSLKVCDDFFPTPTDVGICLTKNIEVKEIIHPNEKFDFIYDAHHQKSKRNIEGGTYWSESTLVFSLDSYNPLSHMYRRQPNVRLGEIQFQLHQSSEFAHLLMDSNYDKFTTSLTLDANNEYFIDVSPTGQLSTEAFRDFDFQQRQCHLQHEVHQKSIFKVYTQNNCYYECEVNLAMEMCKCVPWDFEHIEEINECDVFGRTCFFTAMNNLALNSNDSCSHCIEECDYIKYNRVILNEKTKSVTDGRFLSYLTNVENGECFGSKAFCDYIMDYNFTLKDKGLTNALKALKYDNKPAEILTKFKDLIIVHLRFLKPKIDVLGSKYTVTDKFANFGGIFGIFTQITGCSWLVFINLLILMTKLMFSALRK